MVFSTNAVITPGNILAPTLLQTTVLPADEIIVTDIYAAREKPDGVTTAENLAKDIEMRGVKVRYFSNFSDIEKVLREEIKPNDFVFTMGAGNIVDIADNLCK